MMANWSLLAVLTCLAMASPALAQDEAAPIDDAAAGDMVDLYLMADRLAIATPACVPSRRQVATWLGEQTARAVASILKPRRIESAPEYPDPLVASADNNPAITPSRPLLMADLRIERRNAAGQSITLSRPKLVTVAGRQARIEIGQPQGESLSIQMTIEPLAPSALASPRAALPTSLKQEPVCATPAHYTPPSAFDESPQAAPIRSPEPPADWLTPTAPSPFWSPLTSSHQISLKKPPSSESPTSSTSVPPVDLDPYLNRKLRYEEHYAEKLRSILQHIPNVRVAVEVTLAPITSNAQLTPSQVHVAVTFPDAYVKQLWEAQNPYASPSAGDLLQLMEHERGSIGELVEPLLPAVDDDVRTVVVHSYVAVASTIQPTARPTPPPTTPSVQQASDDIAPWMLGVIAVTLLCASIGAAVLFRRAPAYPPLAPQNVAAADFDAASQTVAAPQPPPRRAA